MLVIKAVCVGIGVALLTP
ncbi:hypothetical protein CGJ66_22990 [Vibrio parahaemolyticus]|nr:hypothetical protein CGJ66_22990 [Vibrio parahaemolyticus]